MNGFVPESWVYCFCEGSPPVREQSKSSTVILTCPFTTSDVSQYYLDSPSLWELYRARSPGPSLGPRGGVEDLFPTEGIRGGGPPTDRAPTKPAGDFPRMPLGIWCGCKDPMRE